MKNNEDFQYKKSVYFQKLSTHIQLRKIFIKTALSFENSFNVVSEAADCLDQVVLVHVGHHMHEGSLQRDLGIVGTFVGLLLEDALEVVDQRLKSEELRGKMMNVT